MKKNWQDYHEGTIFKRGEVHGNKSERDNLEEEKLI